MTDTQGRTGQSGKSVAKQANRSTPDRNTKRTRGTGYGYNKKRAGDTGSNYNTKKAGDSGYDFNTKQNDKVDSNIKKARKNGYNTKRAAKQTSSSAIGQPANKGSDVSTKQRTNTVYSANDKQTERTGSRRSNGYAPKVTPTPQHPAIIRLRAEAAKNKTSNLTGQALASTSNNMTEKKEQSFVKRVASRLFKK